MDRAYRDSGPRIWLAVELRASELAMLLEGIDLRTLGRVRRFSRRAS